MCQTFCVLSIISFNSLHPYEAGTVTHIVQIKKQAQKDGQLGFWVCETRIYLNLYPLSLSRCGSPTGKREAQMGKGARYISSLLQKTACTLQNCGSHSFLNHKSLGPLDEKARGHSLRKLMVVSNFKQYIDIPSSPKSNNYPVAYTLNIKEYVECYSFQLHLKVANRGFQFSK